MKLAYDVFNPYFWQRGNIHPILFLHGLTEYRITWKKVGPIIAKQTGRKAYAIDIRNHGDSPRSPEMNFDVLTQDLVDFMDELNIHRAVLVGTSMGGRIAINFALKYPERTEALVVEDMTPRNVRSGSTSFIGRLTDVAYSFLESIPLDVDLNTAKSELLNGILEFADKKYVYADKLRKHIDMDMIPIRKGAKGFETCADKDAVISMLESNALVQDLPEKNLTYDGPALFVYGDRPLFNLGKDATIKKLFPRAIVKQINHACHMIHLDSPDVFADVVSTFILSQNLHQSKI